MQCPFCDERATRVVDSRLAAEGSQVVGIVRKGVLLEGMQRHELACDDQVMILAGSSARAALGRIFAPAAHTPSLESSRFFGEFVLQPQARLADVAQAYGFAVNPDSAEMTVEQYLVSQFHGKPVVGDQVRLGPVKLVVKDIDGEHIVAVGLKLRPPG